MARDSYTSPLAGRYSSKEMKYVWSEENKFRLWRRLWFVLARAQQRLGLPITNEQLQQMEDNINNIDYEAAEKLEGKLRHDVVAHIHVYGAAAPLAKPIIHQGATSCYVTDNADLIQIKQSIELLRVRIARVISRLCGFAMEYRHLPTLGYTHLQPAQPTTVGKRATLWLNDLLRNLQNLERLDEDLRFRGVKGTTGTQDTFLKLFKGDHEAVKALDGLVTSAFRFTSCFSICGQSYTRQQDSEVVFPLSSFGATAIKMGNDMRLLQSFKEMEEPFAEEQIGSSAMAYKRNPMRMERACSLGRKLMKQVSLALETHSQQWLERTLDDSAIRRFVLPESFLLADSIAIILQNVCEGLVVYPNVIKRRLMEELPFMATEEIILAMVDAGADRQDCHKRIRDLAQAAGKRVKQDGLSNNLLEAIGADPYFTPVHNQLADVVDPSRFIGRAPEQVEEFAEVCRRALEPYSGQLAEKSEIGV